MTGIIEVDGKEAESASLVFELVDLRLENKRLRARVGEIEARYDNVTVALQEKRAELTAIKPDWKDVLKWVKWRARDKDGRLWNYSNEPSKIGDWGWTQEGGMSDMASGCQNWQDTLERRPEES